MLILKRAGGSPTVCVPDDLRAVDAVHHPLAPLIPDLHGRRPRLAQVNVLIHHHPRHTRFAGYHPLLPARRTHTHSGNDPSGHHLRLIPRRDGDSLEDDVWSGVDGPAHVVVGGEGQDLGAAAGPHARGVQRVQRLAQAHDGRVDVAHGQRLYRLPVGPLRGGEKPNGPFRAREDELAEIK